MLLMKAWLETRWRLLAMFTYLLICLAVNYSHRNSGPASARGMLEALGTILVMFSMTLAGSGVKSQSPAGFPEGLAGSTQFTISLPVSRLRLLAVRAAFGMLENVAVAVVIGGLAWSLFPSLRASVAPADFARLLLFIVLWVPAPYCAALFFGTFIDEPLSMVFAGWSIVLLLWIVHHVAPAVGIVRALRQGSPLGTHSLPWSHLAVISALALILLWASVRVVQSREY